MAKLALFGSTLATAVWLAGVAGCDGPLALSTAEGEAPASAEAQDKVSADITADVDSGRTRDVIVLLSEERVAIRRAAFHTAFVGDRFESYLQGVRSDLDEMKSRVMAMAPSAIEVLRTYDNLPVMNVRLHSPAALAALQAQPDVVAVVEDLPMQAFADAPANLNLIGQPAAAAAGNLGAGSTVAVLDTGVDYQRAPFACTAPGEPASCPVVYAQDIAKQDNAVDTGSFHGTNVAGIVLAVAPAAKIIALDVFDGDWAYTSTILSAINWCVQNKAKYNIVAINLSLGGGLFSSACSKDPFAPAIAAARSAGILSAVASGNSASRNSLASPACVPAAVSVGAVYAANVGPLYASICSDKTSAADKVACFSNSASFLTLLAPGVGISAAGITMSGTSQATPHVAGAIAVLASAFPTAGPDTLVTRLTSSGTVVKDARNNVSKPRLDLPAALSASAVEVPVGRVIINGGDAYTKSRTVTVDVTTTSGVATQVCLSTGSSCTAWKAYVASMPFTLSSGDGLKTIKVWWKSANGLTSTQPASGSITLDTAAPTNGVLVAKLMGSVVGLVWAGSVDKGSGVASYKLVSGTGVAPKNCSVGTQLYAGTDLTYVSGELSKGVTTYFRLCTVDKMGNMNTGVQVAVKVPK
jgi:subtilisin family serine protease